MSSDSRIVREAARDLTVIVVFSLAGIAAVDAAARWWKAGASAPTPGHLQVAYREPQPGPADTAVLRVCADPNNLPFSNDREEGFENEIARIVSRELGRRLEYYWQPQRRGFFRTTLNAGWCDVVIGVPARLELAATTRPYYRSTYVFVARTGDGRTVASLDDPRLRRVRIGVEMTGEDYENPPAVQALASRHIIDNMRGYLVYGDYSQPDPPRRVIDAVARGDVDVAIAWGPMAGYFARRSGVPLSVRPVVPERDGPGLTFAFDISMAVRRADTALRSALDGVIASRDSELTAVLDRFGVPWSPPLAAAHPGVTP